MKAYIITTFIGCFGVDENNIIISYRQFPKDVEKIAEKLKLAEIEIIEEEKQLIDELAKKRYKIVFSLRKPGAREIEVNSKAEQFIRENLRKLTIDKKIVKDQIEFNQLLTRINIELTKVKIKKAIERDNLILDVNGAIEELDKSLNVFTERLREWYSLHFPEMDRTIDNHEKFAKLVEKFGYREKMDEGELKHLAEKSMGMNLKEEDIETIQSFASEIIRLYELRKNLSQYLEKLLKEIAPNFTELGGYMIAAKLISKAGSLEKLAKMPSSTIQLLGSEKALFRFLHGRGKSPKFGLIFNHSLIQNAPEEHRGKIARLLASKLSIAAKMDFYSKEFKADKLKKELEESVRETLKKR